jgi:Dyp-type peroxidase family
VLEHGEIQGNVLYAYGNRFPYARYVRLRILDGREADAARVVARWLAEVTFGRRPDALPGEEARRPHLNVAFTYGGLQKLGVPNDLLFAFPEDFRQGARKRAASLGDHWQEAPEDEEDVFKQGDILLVVHSCDGDSMELFNHRHIDGEVGAGAPFTVLYEKSAALLGRDDRGDGATRSPTSCGVQYNREHFGFADGCSQPAVEGSHADGERGETNAAGEGLYTGVRIKRWPVVRLLARLLEDIGLKPILREWRPIRAGEFVLGYENEDGVLPEGPPGPLGPNGTFMVFRDIEQHVGNFNEYIQSQASELGTRPEALRAKIVGRWDDGTPLTLSPDEAQRTIATSRERANDFLYVENHHGYESDAKGFRCPLGAHIRRANPRDALPGGAERTARHRIIRRGMPYGSLWREGDEDGGRGLAFVCFNASITNGFEFIQANWLNDGDVFGLENEPDFLLHEAREQGAPEPMMVIQGPKRAEILRAPKDPFVTVRGCEYLFLPSRRACSWLASLTPAAGGRQPSAGRI